MPSRELQALSSKPCAPSPVLQAADLAMVAITHDVLRSVVFACFCLLRAVQYSVLFQELATASCKN